MSYKNISYSEKELTPIKTLRYGEKVWKTKGFGKTRIYKLVDKIKNLLVLAGYDVDIDRALTNSVYITADNQKKSVYIRISDHFKRDDVLISNTWKNGIRFPKITAFDNYGIDQYKSFDAHITGLKSIEPVTQALIKYIA